MIRKEGEIRKKLEELNQQREELERRYGHHTDGSRALLKKIKTLKWVLCERDKV